MEALDKKIEDLFGRVKLGNCNACGATAWTYDGRIYELRQWPGLDLPATGPHIIPLIVFTCEKCGHVQFFNAIVSRLLTKEGTVTD